MFAIAANALFTSQRRRGTTRQLAGVIVICVISALLLLLALVWYNLRFAAKQGQIPAAEIELALVYIALLGWVLPLGATITYYLFTSPRNSTTALHIPLLKPDTDTNTALLTDPPRHRPGFIPPFVFSEETPWGWLEYRSGNFQGQRLELKRAVATLGRDEDSDIWIDDEMASRHHAELAYNQGKAYLTDCGSLNGVLYNGKRMYGTVEIAANDLLQIGAQSFCFILAEPDVALAEQSDPLVHHKWRSSQDVLTDSSHALPATSPLPEKSPVLAHTEETAELDYKTPQPPATNPGGVLIIRDGDMTGQSFLLDRAVVSVGRSQECDVVINDASISRCHVQFLRQLDGDYVQDLGSRNGTQVNYELLRTPKLLQAGDVVSVGNIRLEYTPVPGAHTVPVPRTVTPYPSTSLITGPTPLRLPSKQKH